MKQFLFQKQEMQIPYENAFSGMEIMNDFDKKFRELSKNYNLHNVKKLKTFIKEHEHIMDFIFEITPLINEYFPNYEKIIEFCEDPEFSNLDFVMIYIVGCSFDKDYKILKNFENEPLYQSKFSRNINGLLCVGLW